MMKSRAVIPSREEVSIRFDRRVRRASLALSESERWG